VNSVRTFADRLDTHEGSLFNKIAKDLAVDMRDYWRPDEGFLKRRNKVQLQALMNESGASLKAGIRRRVQERRTGQIPDQVFPKRKEGQEADGKRPESQ
jgi:hypothetical protein